MVLCSICGEAHTSMVFYWFWIFERMAKWIFWKCVKWRNSRLVNRFSRYWVFCGFTKVPYRFPIFYFANQKPVSWLITPHFFFRTQQRKLVPQCREVSPLWILGSSSVVSPHPCVCQKSSLCKFLPFLHHPFFHFQHIPFTNRQAWSCCLRGCLGAHEASRDAGCSQCLSVDGWEYRSMEKFEGWHHFGGRRAQSFPEGHRSDVEAESNR